jgi:hypothetical protein
MIPRFYQIPGNFPKYKPILAYTGPSQYIPTGYPSTHPFLSLTGSLNGIEIEPVHTFGFQSHFSSTKTYNQKPTNGRACALSPRELFHLPVSVIKIEKFG